MQSSQCRLIQHGLDQAKIENDTREWRLCAIGASNKVSGTMPRNESHRLRMLTAITANARPCNSDTLRGRSDAVALQSWDVPAQLACTPEFFTIGIHLFTSLATKALNTAGVDP